jgi:phosphoglycerate dehydrogenase-like enzyme
LSQGRYRIWFERPVTDELLDLVNPDIEQLGGGTRQDPWLGIESTRAVVASSLRYGATVMDRAPHLEVISRTGIGYDLVDVPGATARRIVVCNAPEGPTVSTAEHAVTLILMASKNVLKSIDELRAGGSDFYPRNRALELDGKRLGLVGFGRIARHVARVAQSLGMRVAAFDPFVEGADFFVDRVDTLAELLAASDVVSVHIPLTADTAQMFDATTFAQMKAGAVFVNTARGGLVDHDALTAALASGHLFSAGLDVTDPEPLAPGAALLARDDVVVTPHVASGTFAGRRRIFRTAVEQAVAVLDGVVPAHMVNPEVWPQRRRRRGH